jgi:hypothetical protein
MRSAEAIGKHWCQVFVAYTLLRAKRAFAVAREQFDEVAWELHRSVLEVKIQVMAQYGSDSTVLHAVGREQRSERKRPVRRDPSMQ